MGQALYRKYRSKSLGEVVGQEHITTTLATAIKNGRISHAYLFTGPRGTGKTSVARILANEVNGLSYSDKTHLDIIEIDAASNRRIDDIRDLREKVHIAPTSAKYKVYIIDEVHMLTGESFNALLKTLEEPPSHVIFILATTEVHKLPATIISRTQRYTFRLGEQKKIMAHLKHIAQQEKITIDDSALQLIAEHGEGSFRDSVSLLDQLANVSDGTITAETVEQNLGLASRQTIKTLVEAIIEKNHKALITQLDKLEQQGATPSSLVPQLLRVLQTVAPKQPSLYHLLDELLEVPRAYNPSIKLLTTLVGFVIEGSEKLDTPKHTPTVAQIPKPILEIAKAPAQLKREATTSKKEKSVDVPTGGAVLSDISPVQWQEVLAAIKIVSPPLFSILKQTQPVFTADTQTLVLKCRYSLHQKKIDDAKAKSELAKIMMKVLGGAPILQAETDTKAQPPIFKATVAPAPEMDETTKSVAAIMGGGEAVND